MKDTKETKDMEKANETKKRTFRTAEGLTPENMCVYGFMLEDMARNTSGDNDYLFAALCAVFNEIAAAKLGMGIEEWYEKISGMAVEVKEMEGGYRFRENPEGFHADIEVTETDDATAG